MVLTFESMDENLKCDHANESYRAILSVGVIHFSFSVLEHFVFSESNLFLCVPFQVVPILLHLVKAISSVRLYIPKDLRSLDSRQSVGKSIKVRTSVIP